MASINFGCSYPTEGCIDSQYLSYNPSARVAVTVLRTLLSCAITSHAATSTAGQYCAHRSFLCAAISGPSLCRASIVLYYTVLYNIIIYYITLSLDRHIVVLAHVISYVVPGAVLVAPPRSSRRSCGQATFY